tara:strand:+ start:57 stop:1082 length:1026 start_codon:yes stop_codon:yes gene_type:complete
MKILITGGCGFIGSNLAIFLKQKKFNVYSLDNLFRKGSEINLKRLRKTNIKNFKIDISDYKKFKFLPKFDIIIDCCAEPSVTASNQDIDRVINTNFIGTFNILKKCVKDKSKIIFLSSSRVYPIEKLRNISKSKNLTKPIKIKKKIDISFPLNGAKSIYGFSKLSSEELIKEFNYTNKIDYIINRLGVVAGPWQFGKVDQGFFSLWLWRHINNKDLKYIGFGGYGNQVRDVLHIDDLNNLILKQLKSINKIFNRKFTVGGDSRNAISLKELTLLCRKITNNKINIKKLKTTNIYDIPYFVTSNTKVSQIYKWKPKKNLHDIAVDIYNWQLKNYKTLKTILK